MILVHINFRYNKIKTSFKNHVIEYIINSIFSYIFFDLNMVFWVKILNN